MRSTRSRGAPFTVFTPALAYGAVSRDVRSWLWPVAVLILVLLKLVGLIAGVVALATYFPLKAKLGIAGAVVASTVLALIAGVAVVATLDGV